ncbi:cupin domain-containing protein [Nafulsella turpanensis]|uniref:cupin domain-containing protein n=1 Tax=Nafulsella turpanensis TaxID=1265690 RepID=UPI001268E117|nr:cupin domain-containing protein [Nafulsella turpanensis]
MESRNDNQVAGSRTSHDGLFNFSLPALVQELKQENSWAKTGRSARLMHKSEALRLLLNVLKAGTEIKPHQAPGPITVHCIEGKIKFFAEDKAVTLEAGEMLSLEAFIRHSVEALEESAFLLTIIPLNVPDKK